MSIRSEYSWTLEYKPELGWSLWVTWAHSASPVKGMIMPNGLVESDNWLEVCEREAERLISSHMERVTRILEGGVPPENGEATDMTTLADHLAHKSDHDNQCERDLEP